MSMFICDIFAINSSILADSWQNVETVIDLGVNSCCN